MSEKVHGVGAWSPTPGTIDIHLTNVSSTSAGATSIPMAYRSVSKKTGILAYPPPSVELRLDFLRALAGGWRGESQVLRGRLNSTAGFFFV
eukprot:gene18319-biopygen18958